MRAMRSDGTEDGENDGRVGQQGHGVGDWGDEAVRSSTTEVTWVIEGTLWFRRTRLLPPSSWEACRCLSKKPEGPMNADFTADVLCYSGCGCDS